MLTDALLVALTVEHGAKTADCLEAKALERAVERRLKRRVFVAAADAQLHLRVSFARNDAGVEAKIALSNPDGAARGTRVLSTTNHCSALDDSLALSVALLVDEPPDPEPVVATREAPAAVAAPPAPPPARVITIPADVAAPREPWHVRFGVAAKAGWGILPGVRPALSLQLSLVPRGFWPILVQADGFLPTNAERDDASGARFRLFRAGLALCPVLDQTEAHGLGVCVGQQLGWIDVEGYGFDRNATEKRLSFALSAGGEGRVQLLSPVSLRAYLGAEVPLVRDRFTSGGTNAVELFELSPVGIFGEIGLEATLW